MADFKTHITTSSVLGAVYGTVGFYVLEVPPAHCMIAGVLCSVAGMLPDLDSDSGIPLREMLSFVSVLVPMLMIPRFEALEFSKEQMVFVAGVMYFLIRFGIGALFKRFTKHRGMWHSIPAALIAGLVTFVVCLSTDFEIRIFKAWAVVLGFVCHLFLDEIYAVNWQGAMPTAKRSFGTALKFAGKDKLANFVTWGKLILLVGLVASDDYAMSCFCDQTAAQHPESAAEWFQSLFLHSAQQPSEMPLSR
ncbi:MAG: metal-dependent hydrolase [Planctomycetota bacterium]